MFFFKTKTAGASKLIEQSNRFAAATAFLHNYPAFEKERVERKIEEMRVRIGKEVEADPTNTETMMDALLRFQNYCSSVQKTVEASKILVDFAAIHVARYHVSPTVDGLQTIERFVENLKADY